MYKAYCKTYRKGLADTEIGKFQHVFQEEAQHFCSEGRRSHFVQDPEKYTTYDDATDD